MSHSLETFNILRIVSKRAIRPELAQATDAALAAFATAKHGIPFNMSSFYALRAARRRNRDGDGTKYYCTELVAAALQHMSVLAGLDLRADVLAAKCQLPS